MADSVKTKDGDNAPLGRGWTPAAASSDTMTSCVGNPEHNRTSATARLRLSGAWSGAVGSTGNNSGAVGGSSGSTAEWYTRSL